MLSCSACRRYRQRSAVKRVGLPMSTLAKAWLPHKVHAVQGFKRLLRRGLRTERGL